ncbi:MAG: hypothetical protein JNL57_00445 [Bacteroidetes bacterium]|nr:hypothetical protein [Bacteroidota bacterium]
METTEQRLTRIREAVERLLSENNELKAAEKQLNDRIQELEKTIELQKNTIADLTDRNKMIKLAKNLSLTGSDHFDMKIKINELVRDIDRCIDLLNE